MSSFKDTVTKLAQKESTGPLAVQVLQFFKTASIPTTVKHDILKSVIAAGAVGAGGYLANKVLDRVGGESQSRLEGERKEYGQLAGEHKFRLHSVARLKPLHAEIMHSLERDPDFVKAPTGLVRDTYSTMRRFAPYLAADPSVARSFVKEHVILHGATPSYATLKTLADAEQSVNKAGVMEI